MAGQSKGVGRAGRGAGRGGEFFWWKAVKHGKRQITMLDVQNSARVLGFDECFFKNNTDERNIIQRYKNVLGNSANVEEFKRKWKEILIKQDVPRRLSRPAARASSPPAPSPPAPSPATMRQKLEQENELALVEREQFVLMGQREVKTKLAKLEELLDRTKIAEHEFERSALERSKMAAPKIVLGIKEGAVVHPDDVQLDIPFREDRKNPAVRGEKLEASDVVDAEPASAPPVADCNCGCRCS